MPLYDQYPKLRSLYDDVTYDPQKGTVGVQGHTFGKAQVPGAKYDPQGWRHHVYDQEALATALGAPQPEAAPVEQQGWRPAPVPSPDLPPSIQSQVSDYTQRHDASRHRQQLESLLASPPQWEQTTERERLEAARRDAGLQIDPHTEALQRAYEREMQALVAQREHAEAAHAGYEADLEYALGQASQQALEAAIARGGGRAGLADWKETELKKPIIGQAQRIAAEHEATLKDIAAQKTMAAQHHNHQMVGLEQRRGELEAQLMQMYAERDHAMAAQDWERAYNATMQIEQIDEQKRQFDAQMAQAEAQFQEQQRQFDSQMAMQQAQFQEQQRQFEVESDFREAEFAFTQEQAEKDRVLREIEIFGGTGGGTGADTTPTTARDYVGRHGGTIDWRRAPDGGDIVTINGMDIHVQAAGGSNVGGKVQLPKDVLDAAL